MRNAKREQQLSRLRRFLSKVLKHQSPKFPVPLDDEGYADLSDIMYILKRLPNFRWVRVVDVMEVAGGEDNSYYDVVKQGKVTRIRAKKRQQTAESSTPYVNES